MEEVHALFDRPRWSVEAMVDEGPTLEVNRKQAGHVVGEMMSMEVGGAI